MEKAMYKSHIDKIFFRNNLKLDMLSVYNIAYSTTESPPYKDSSNRKSVLIGMDIINRSNWIFDFEKKTIHVGYSNSKILDIIGSPDLIVSYNTYVSSGNTKATFFFNNVEMKDIVLDTGHPGEIILPEDEINRLNLDIEWDNNNPIYGIIKEININNTKYKNISIYKSKGFRAIGSTFFSKHHHHIWIAPKEKEYRFYLKKSSNPDRSNRKK